VLSSIFEKPIVVPIDRSLPLSLPFGGYEIYQQDERSLEIATLDISWIFLKSSFHPENPKIITLEQKLTSLYEREYISLDLQVFWELWLARFFLPGSWRWLSPIFFDGTVLKDKTANEFYVICMYLCEKGEWVYGRCWFDQYWQSKFFVATLKCPS